MSKKTCSLCFAGRLTYEQEIEKKNSAIQEWWKSLSINATCSPLVPSPQGRLYRTVSKRKAFLVNRRFSLGLIGVDDDTARSFPMTISECVIEPKGHTQVYTSVQNYLQRKENFSLAEEFNYVIVKGTGDELAVIFNMNHFSSANRKEVNHLSKYITGKEPAVKSLFVFVDEERSKFYLSDRRTKNDGKRQPMQKIFGAEKIFHKVGNKKFLYSPLSFSQTNHSIVESFTDTAKQLLGLTASDTLIDLYCGYGLFSICLADSAHRVTGIELSRPAINDAIDNARRNKITNCKFLSADISAQSLQRIIASHKDSHESKTHTHLLKVLLDPPRNGTAPGVIEFIAGQSPECVVHIFCNAEIMPRDLNRWKDCGYDIEIAIPFDMFPGTGEIEMMVKLSKKDD